MGALDQSLLDAMNSIAQSSVKASNATLTIECTVEEVVDAGLQIYQVKYRDNSFNVSSSSGAYEVGDIVYVLVPEGDFSKPKIILGAVTTSSVNLDEDDITDEYTELDGTLLIATGDLDLNTQWGDRTEDVDIEADKFQKALINYVSIGRRDFIFSLQIKTQIDTYKQTTAGKYGIYLHIPVLEDPGDGSDLILTEIIDGVEHQTINPKQETERTLNIDSRYLLGNPFKLNTWTTQKVKFSLPEGSEIDPTKMPYLIKKVSNFYSNESIEEPDILIQNLSFNPIQYLTEIQQSTTYLSIVCDTGLFFVANSATVKTLKPLLRINGKKTKVENSDKYECYWFKKDNNINTTSKTYLPIGGAGQSCLNDFDDGANTYITNVFELEVKESEVLAQATYKCILINKDTNKQYQATEDIINKRSSIIDFELVTADGLYDFVKDTGFVNLIVRVKSTEKITDLVTAFQRIDKDGQTYAEEYTYINPTEGKPDYQYKEGANQIVEKYYSLAVSHIDTLNTISCTFATTNATIGVRNIVVTTGAKPEQRLAIENQDVLYKYDSDGNSPMVADYAYPMDKINYITPLSFRIFRPDNTEISEEERKYCKVLQTVPKNSLFKFPTATEHNDDYYLITDKELDYGIADVYNAKKVDNYVTLSIEFKDIILYQTVNLKFVKEGEIGTNGSRYTAVITYNGSAYGDIKNSKIKKLQLAYGKGKDNQFHQFYTDEVGGELVNVIDQYGEEINFKDNFAVNVYCNGKVDNTVIKDEEEQGLFDPWNTNPVLEYSNGQLKIQKDRTIAADSVFSTVVQVKAIIKRTDETTGTPYSETVYSYYPVEVTFANAVLEGEKIPHIADGYYKVIYASDCTNPQFDSSNPFRIENNLDFTQKKDDVYTYTQSKNKNLTIVGANNKISCQINPKTRYDSAESLNYVKVDLGIDNVETEEKYKAVKEEAERNKNIAIANKEQIKTLAGISEEGEEPKENQLITIFNNISNLIEEIEDSQDPAKKINLYYSYQDDACTNLNSILKRAADVKKICASGKKTLKTAGEDWYNQIINEVITRRRPLWKIGLNRDRLNIIDPFDKNSNVFKTKFESVTKKTTKALINNILDRIDDFNKALANLKNDEDDKASYTDYAVLIRDIVDFEIKFPDGDAPEGFAQNANDLLSWNDTYQKAIMRVTDPFNGATFETPQDEIDAQEELYPKENPIQSFLGDMVQNVTTKTENILKDKTAEYYTLLCEEGVDYYNEQIKGYDIIINDCKQIIDFYTIAQLTITRPIILLTNTYELSNIADQDGNKLYIDDNHGDDAQYLFAPQIGAGIKEDRNGIKKFTGVVMGVRGFGRDQQAQKKSNQVGIFAQGYGEQTYFLNARDGSAIMGKGYGQIIIDPSTEKGLIYSSNYQKDYDDSGKPLNYNIGNQTGQGMLINLTDAYVHVCNATYELDENGERKKDEDGNDIIITPAGKFYSGIHSTINSTESGFFLNEDGLSIGSKVYIDKDGIARFGTNAVGKGTKCQTINGGNPGENIDSYIGYNASDFGVTFTKDATTKEITDVTVDNSLAKSPSVYIGTDGIRLGKKFAVSSEGDLLSNNAYITGTVYAKRGMIGDWTISGGKIEGNKSNGQIILDAYGAIEGKNGDKSQSINRSGKATFNDIEITGGKLNINGNADIDPDGNATFNHITCKSIFTFGDPESGSNYWSNASGSNNFSFGMGNYGSFASGGFNLKGGGTAYGSEGLNMSATTTKVGTQTLPNYVGDIIANTIDAQYIIDHGGLTVEGLSNLNSVTVKRLNISSSPLEIGTFTIGNYRIYPHTTTIDGATIKYLAQNAITK